ncbi:MAG: MgtC/SapB family protein [Clostridia bacterium]|nr:MgtC/SapB family protein [Clostridia bacterium]
MLPQLDFLREPTLLAAAIRLFVAMLFGGILGIERGLKKRPAGFRTYMLVCVGAALVMVTNQYITEIFHTGDPARLGAQVISGIGFLGAGTIIVTGRNQVKGLTTAAGLWTAACLGLATGLGFIEIAVIAFICMYLSLTLFHRIDKFLVGRSRVLDLLIEFKSIKYMGGFTKMLREKGIKLSNLEYIRNVDENNDATTIVVTLQLKQRGTHADFISELSTIDGIKNIEEIL